MLGMAVTLRSDDTHARTSQAGRYQAPALGSLPDPPPPPPLFFAEGWTPPTTRTQTSCPQVGEGRPGASGRRSQAWGTEDPDPVPAQPGAAVGFGQGPPSLGLHYLPLKVDEQQRGS